jgi:molybdopterin-guanine dinucleotide biosynthesis protein A
MKVSGIILAGGKSSRMGQDKGLIPIDGKPMIQNIIDALEPITEEIIIIANNKGYESFGLPVFKDEFEEKGPIAGIYQGLKQSSNAINFIISCDVPHINTSFLNWLLSAYKKDQVTIPKTDGREQHMIGVYPKSKTHKYKEFIQRNELKLKLANEEIGCQYIEVPIDQFPMELFRNINTKEDLNQL